MKNPYLKFYYRLISPFYDLLMELSFHGKRNDLIRALDLKNTDKVLEVCTGTGTNLNMIKNKCLKAGIDFSKPMIKKAGIENKFLMDAEHLAFKDNAFDKVFCSYTLSIVKNPEKVLEEMKRVCRRRGKIAVMDYVSGNKFEKAVGKAVHYFGVDTSVDSMKLLKNAGLKITKNEYFFFNRYVIAQACK